MLGTPAYMAPEQHRGEPVDHRGDQYAFCVAIYHAVSGKRPFRARPGVELARVKMTEPPPPLPGVPKHVQRAVARGLSPDPGDRFESMAALLAELERRPGGNLRRAGAVAAVAAAVGGAWGFAAWSRAQRAAACAELGAQIDAQYDATTREGIEAGIENTGLAYAETTRDSTLRWLDEHAVQWAAAKEESCRRAEVDAAWTAQTRARADWCLEESLARFSALTERLVTADAIDVETASERAAALPPPGRCVDEQSLQSLQVPPEQTREALRATQRTLARAAAMIRSQQADEALGLAQGALAEAEDAGFLPVVARAHMTVADALDAKGEFPPGTQARKLAYFAAMEAGASQLAGAAATGLIFSTGVNLAHEQEAQDWYRHATIALRAAGASAGDLALANAELNIATVDFYAAEVARAAPRFREVLAVRESTLGATHPEVATVLNMLGSSIARSGDFPAGRVLFERALKIQRALYGEEHPAVATTLHNIATGLHVQGDFSAAAEIYEQSLAIRERSLRPDHPDIGLSLNNLAGIAWELGDKRKSLEVSQRALAILESQYGPSHPRVANSLTGVAGTHVALNETAEAIPLLERAVAIYDEHPRGAKSNEPTARYELAKALVATAGDLARARDEANKARRLYAELGEQGAKSVADIRAFLDEIQ
ncbi:MAG: tetratricopeptide repeat-containing protein kinase family protein [Myxococcota bacterium]